MALTSFELGRLKVLGHVREELDRAGIEAQSIQCRSGGLQTPPGIARLAIMVNGTLSTLDLTANEIEGFLFKGVDAERLLGVRFSGRVDADSAGRPRE